MRKEHVSLSRVTVRVNRPAEEVFDFITTPRFWDRWHPATDAVLSGSSAPAREGENIVERVRHGPLKDVFRWRVVGCQAPCRWSIEGVSDRFRQRVRIDYILEPQGEGTSWTREMRFYFPAAIKPLDRLFFNGVLQRNSRKAQRRLKEYLEGRPPRR